VQENISGQSEVQGNFRHGLLPDIKSIPEPVDHVVVSIPAAGVLDLLDDCAEKGVQSVHFFTAGFSESGRADRVDLEKAMLAKARSGGFRIIGPNCVGFYIPDSKQANITGVSHEPGPVAFISQSGGHAHNMVEYGDPKGLRFSKVISYGNGLDVNEIELLNYFAKDPKTEVIGIYIEGTRNGKEFTQALHRAGAVKPVVIYKGGKSEAGKRATFGHTASMTSSVSIFSAVCRQANAIYTDDMDQMIDVMTALCDSEHLPLGPGVGMLGAGGGPSVQAGDVMEKEGLMLPPLSARAEGRLKEVLPVDGSIFANPLDTPNMASPDAIYKTLAVIGGLPEIHMLVYHQGFHPISRWGMGRFSTDVFKKDFVEALLSARKETRKPVYTILRAPLHMAGLEEFLSVQSTLVKARLPVFYDFSNFSKAIAGILQWKKNKK
jgi:acyl-CoA synthetase (NDP forming)